MMNRPDGKFSRRVPTEPSADGDAEIIPETVWRPVLHRVLLERARDARTPIQPIVRYGIPGNETTIDVDKNPVAPGEPPVVTISGLGVLVQNEAGITIHMYDGSRYQKRLDGSVETRAAHVERIGVYDITQVTSHQITRVFDMTSHVMTFIGGGTYSFMMDSNGRVVEQHSHRMCLRTDRHDVTTLFGRAFPESDPDHEAPRNA